MRRRKPSPAVKRPDADPDRAIAIGVSATPVFIRLTRGQTMAIKAEEFILAARAIGNPPWRVALRHVLPNIVPALIVQATLAIAAAVIAEASLSFLGLGQQPPAPSWGSIRPRPSPGRFRS